MSALSGHQEVLKVLTKQMPALVLKGDDEGVSAVHHAVWGGSGRCLKTLASHCSWRVGVALRDRWGRTPLIIAAAKVIKATSLKRTTSQNRRLDIS